MSNKAFIEQIQDLEKKIKDDRHELGHLKKALAQRKRLAAKESFKTDSAWVRKSLRQLLEEDRLSPKAKVDPRFSFSNPEKALDSSYWKMHKGTCSLPYQFRFCVPLDQGWRLSCIVGSTTVYPDCEWFFYALLIDQAGSVKRRSQKEKCSSYGGASLDYMETYADADKVESLLRQAAEGFIAKM